MTGDERLEGREGMRATSGATARGTGKRLISGGRAGADGQDRRHFPRQEKSELGTLDPQKSASTRKIGPITCEELFYHRQTGNWLCYCLRDPSETGNTENRLASTGLETFRGCRGGGRCGLVPS